MKANQALSLAILMAGSLGIGFAAPADQNWPQWRGPLQTGVAPQGDPPTEWSETKNIRWKAKLPGEGSSTPIIWDKHVFIQAAVPKQGTTAAVVSENAGVFGQATPPPQEGGRRRRGGGGGFGGGEAPKNPYDFTLIAIDRATGKPAWEKVLRSEVPHESHHRDGTFASASPVCDGEHIIAYFGSRGLYALDMKGEVKWQKDLGKARTKNSFGEGSSPALHGKYLVVNWDHEGEDFIVTFDKTSGKELWRQKRDEDTSWSTPLIVTHGGQPQAVVNASRKVRSYDLATGKELWSVGPLTANVIPSAVAAGDRVYAMSGFRGAQLYAIKLGKTGELTGTDAIVWTHTKSTPYVPSPLLYEDRLYFFAGNNATLSVLDAKSGQPLVDAERLEGMMGVYASPAGAAGRVYLVGRDGGAVVLKKGDKLEILGTNKLNDGFDASPAIAGKELYLRGKQNLYCIAAN